MKSKEYVLKRLFSVLAELESETATKEVETMLKHQLSVYNEILDDEDIPEAYWEKIEELL